MKAKRGFHQRALFCPFFKLTEFMKLNYFKNFASNKINVRHLAAVFIFCQVFYINFLHAQEVSNQLWLEYRPTYNFTPKFKIDIRFSFRDEFAETNWHTWEAGLFRYISFPNVLMLIWDYRL